MESTFSSININDDEDNESNFQNQNSILANQDEDANTDSIQSINKPEKFQDRTSISSKSQSEPKIETDNIIKENENFYQVFSSLIMDQLNTPDVNDILNSQRKILKRLETTNSNLVKTNQQSIETLSLYGLKDYHSYINLLHSMKIDLEAIFKRIRLLKSKFQTKYPYEYKNALEIILQSKNTKESDEEDDENLETLKRMQQLNPSPSKIVLKQKVTIVNDEYQNELKEANKLLENKHEKSENLSNEKLPPTTSAHQTTSIIANLILTARDRVNSIGKENVSNLSDKIQTKSAPEPNIQKD